MMKKKSNEVSDTIEETNDDSGEQNEGSEDLEGKNIDDSANECSSVGHEKNHKKRKILQTVVDERDFPAVNSKRKIWTRSHQLSHTKV